MKKDSEKHGFEQRFRECDAKFNSIFELSSVATKIINSDLTILKVNKALCELLGYTAEEILGTRILDHACEEHIDHWHHLQEELWAKQVPNFKLKACLYRKDREIVWVDVTTILYTDQGETFGFTVLDDITGLKHFENSKKRLNVALKSSGTAIWELDIKSGEVFRSAHHDQLFGYHSNREKWFLEDYNPHLSERDLEGFKSALQKINETDGLDVQVRVLRKDEQLQWLNIKGTPERDHSGQVVRVIGVINDITKDKLIERHKDDFISIASHELKTPVTSLKASLQLLDRSQDGASERVKSLILQANKGINRITAIIDDLLNAGKNYEEQLSLRKEKFDIYLLAEEVIGQFEALPTQSIELLGHKNSMLRADAERIGRVLTNLIGNAIKYAPKSSKIKVNIENQQESIRVSVIDKGPGIPRDKIPLLFDRYYQATDNQNSASGLGLGLFISANIVRKHLGKIGVSSDPLSGTDFWFELPK